MKTDETHLSAEQTQAPKGVWLPQKDVHCQGTPSDQPTTTPGTQTPDDCLDTRTVKTYDLPKSARILYNRQFNRIMKAGTKMAGSSVFIHFRFYPSQRAKLGVTVSKKHGKAHDRNRFKRVVREAFRLCQHEFPQDLELNITPLVKKRLDTPSVIKDFLYFAQRLKRNGK